MVRDGGEGGGGGGDGGGRVQSLAGRLLGGLLRSPNRLTPALRRPPPAALLLTNPLGAEDSLHSSTACSTLAAQRLPSYHVQVAVTSRTDAATVACRKWGPTSLAWSLHRANRLARHPLPPHASCRCSRGQPQRQDQRSGERPDQPHGASLARALKHGGSRPCRQ